MKNQTFHPMFEIGLACDPGVKRSAQPNQDRVGVAPHPLWKWRAPLLVVADGMGGHAGGAMASRIVVDVFIDEYKRLRLFQNSERMLTELVHTAHRNIRKRGVADAEYAQMGSTVVAAMLTNKQVSLVNVGDSRAYLFRNGTPAQLSTDQSWVAEQVRAGLLTEAEALVHPYRSRLSMGISAKREDVVPVITRHDLQPGDIILLCSDGLWSVVDIQVITEVILAQSAQQAADNLVRRAIEAGGPDNISVIIARYVA